jgi:hypothetical protein
VNAKETALDLLLRLERYQAVGMDQGGLRRDRDTVAAALLAQWDAAVEAAAQRIADRREEWCPVGDAASATMAGVVRAELDHVAALVSALKGQGGLT